MQEIHVLPGNVKANVTFMGDLGVYAYLELALGPIKQRGYIARARYTKDSKAWVEITPPQQKGVDGKFHVLSFIEDKEFWKFVMEALTNAYLGELSTQDISLEQVAELNRGKEHAQ